ncbi:prolipoprotein diacylglyceryl transferase [Candidatus Uhrbacteria bacterium]|nr:prolipoprotein diacylglyceryl transferase [Candidatus Uhrbacteria bacterium]
MIPYFHFTTIPLGPITIQVWGLMVALGILAGAWAAGKMARTRGQDPQLIWDLTFWVIIGAFLFARLFHIFYEPQMYAQSPVEIFKIWHGGLSVMGGFFGAALFGIFFLKRKHADIFAYADTAVFGLPLGLFIGRIGCFLTHLHPGTRTSFFLGVLYPDGVRHDLGLYLSINGLILFLVFLVFARRRSASGTYMVTFLLWYGTVRFFLDFLRATDGPIVDARYAHLTPAQYVAMVMIAGGLWLRWYRKAHQ